MAISAAELRPRPAVALFDAAVRLCTRSTGLWALTLPGGAAVTAAAIHFLDAARAGEDGWAPALLLTAAWFFRALCQGAAAHWTQELLVGQGEASAARSFLAALRRLPSLCIATVVLAVGYVLTTAFTLGVGVFFFASHLVGHAAVMQGKGHPLAIWTTAGTLLGPSRRTASSVRICLWSQLVLLVNLHLAAQLGLYLARTLLGLDLTFATRYASLDNPTWVLSVIAVGFALVEPVRAALGTLLLLDGRVRQEGLDLLSAVEQLPSRARPARAAAVALLLCACALCPAAARAQGERGAPSALDQHVYTMGLARACEVPVEDVEPRLGALEQLDARQRRAYQRFLERVSWYVDDGDCDGARVMLFSGLDQVERAAGPRDGDGAESAAARARAILERPEFRQPAPRKATPEPEEKPEEGESAWDRFWRRVGEWLREAFKPRRRAPVADAGFATGGGELVANALAVALVAGVLVALAVVLLRWKRPGRPGEEEAAPGVVSEPLAAGDAQESALSRPPEGWASLADELAARGQFREAVRGLYLAALSRLHREGALDYDPALSNWEHVRRFKGPLAWKPPFRELTLRFDFVFYGNVGGTADGYREFRALCRPLLEPTPKAA